MKAQCFKCERDVEAWDNSDDGAWDIPCGVVFDGGHNFGSRHYDSGITGKYVRIIVCDECSIAHKALMQERDVPGWEERKLESKRLLAEFVQRRRYNSLR